MFRLLPVLLVAACSTAAAATLCAAGEHVVFSCTTTKGRKIVSLCSSPARAPGKITLTYRFGRPGQVELQFPRESVEGDAARFRYAHYFRARAERTEVTFHTGDAGYSVFRYDDADEAPSTVAGVRVSRRGRTTELLCNGRSVADFPVLEGSVPCDEDNALASCR